jgi:hypothetical protein
MALQANFRVNYFKGLTRIKGFKNKAKLWDLIQFFPR